MNKPFALLAAVVIGTTMNTPVNAQDEEGGVRFGLRLSPNFGFITPDTKGLDGAGSDFGYSFGLLADFPIGSRGNYMFASGLFLNNINGGISQDLVYKEVPGGPDKTKALQTDMKLRYIEVPLTIKMLTQEIGYMRYFAQLGIGTAFNIRAKADQTIPAYDPSGFYVTGFEEEEDEDIMDDVNLFKSSLIIGGGGEYNFSGSTSLVFGITYNGGFTDILDLEVTDESGERTNVKANASYVELMLGVFF